MKKILFIDFNKSYAGGQVYLRNVINQLTKMDIDCWLISNNPNNFFNDIKIPIINKIEVVNKYSYFIKIARSVNYLVKSELIESIVLNGNRAIYLAPLLQSKNINIITHSMPSFNSGLKFFISKYAVKFIANNYIENVITLSSIQKKELISYGIKESLIHVIYNGVNKEFFSEYNKTKKNSKDIIITEVGNLEERKGYKETIHAFSQLARKHSNVKLWIIGTGKKEYEDYLKNLIKKAEIENVVFWGYQSNVKKFLDDTDLFILPSYNECLPISILEAMASSIPIVASKVGGIPEIIEDGVNGYLVKPRDEKDLFQKMDKLISNFEIRKNMAKENYKKCKLFFSNEDSVKKLVETLNNRME